MAKYLFVYHRGSQPDGKAEIKKVMDAWGMWFQGMGAAVVDGGNPVGKSRTVQSNGKVADNGGANPASGYSLIEASSFDDAVAKAKDCPILAAGGSMELAEVIDMQNVRPTPNTVALKRLVRRIAARIRRPLERSGFSLHAGMAANASQRDKIERLARFVSRPPVTTERFSLTQGGNVRDSHKTPYRDGTTHLAPPRSVSIRRIRAKRRPGAMS